MDGVERVRAQNRRRYYERIARMKATGEYEVFKAKKTAEGMRRLSEEKRNEIRRKNRLLNKAWIERIEGGGDLQGLQTTLERKWLPKSKPWVWRRGKPSRNRDILGA